MGRTLATIIALIVALTPLGGCSNTAKAPEPVTVAYAPFVLRERLPSRGGVLHCYSEDYAYAKRALQLDLRISFAGNVTYRNARNLHEAATGIPLDRILVESEAPFMVPSAYRGKRNRPSYLVETVKFIAELRNIPVEELAETLYQNSLGFFGIPDGQRRNTV